jgi:nucleotide-binding universal stress UspA family protein
VLLLAIIRSSAGLPMAGGVNPSGVVEAEQEEAKQALAEGLERLKARGIDAKTALGYGDPVEEITRHAKDFGADLVVVGHKRRGNFERWWARSIGRSLLNDLPCSLLISTPEGNED